LPALRHLGLANSEFVDSAIEALAGSKILPRLRTLDLSHGVMAGRGARLLVEHAPAFGHLASIDLDHNFLLPGEVSQIKQALPNIKVGEQRDRGDSDDEDEAEDGDDRYVALSE
jgi:hypothetical protein